MSKINIIQNAIRELEGGSFQKLFDAYLYKKYKFNNIQTLGVQTGTNKTTKGTPDSYVFEEDGSLILIMYGTVETSSAKKIIDDINACFNQDKLIIDKGKIKKIICAYSSTNIHAEQIQEIQDLIEDVQIELIGLSTISHDLLVNYPFLAAEYLSIPVDTEQIYAIDDFINKYDKNGMNAPLDMNFIGRQEELTKLYTSIIESNITLVTGASGIGKTRLILEVCRQFEKEEWNVLCVKNNGELLYTDIKYYISDKGKYILFIDDANHTTSLPFVLEFISNLSEDIVVHIVMSVRDYAKHRVRKDVCKYGIPSEIVIKSLNSDDIKDILENNLGILNETYIERIVEIAKGNARLAILAGKIAIDKGYLAISNTTDIFKNYYGEIIRSSELDKESVNALFVIALLGPIRFCENPKTLQILEFIGLNQDKFVELCHELNEKELIDLYQNEAVKISDQSFGNYIFEYVLVETKNIAISDILKIGFPQFKNKLVYALNTIMRLFYSDEIKKYIEEQVNISWYAAEEKKQWEYLKAFHALNEEKTLLILKNKIEQMEEVKVDLSDFDFEKKKNNNSITADEINILCGFKYSEYYMESMQLLLMYFEKRPDKVMEIYFAFADRMSYDTESYRLNYEKEYELIECIWNNTDEGKSSNLTLLMLHILKEMLKCNFHRAEATENDRTINWITFHIVLNDGAKKLRRFIWEILSKLYTNSVYRQTVEEILSDSYISGIEKEYAEEISLFDLDCIKEFLFDKWDRLTFEQCKILGKIKKHFLWMGIGENNLFDRAYSNNDFVVYHTLVKERIIGRSWEEEEELRQKDIQEMISEFKECDFQNMFQICKRCEKENDREQWSLNSGLDIVFEELESNTEKYVSVVKMYLLCGAPYGNTPVKIIAYLLKKIGFELTKELIENAEFDYKHIWLCKLWEIIPEELIDTERANQFLEFIKAEVSSENPILPYIINLEKYTKVKRDVVTVISEMVLENLSQKKNIIMQFFGHYLDSDRADIMERLYYENIELLEKLYLYAMKKTFDYEGDLLIRLVKRNTSFWNEVTHALSGNITRGLYIHNIFDKIWDMDNYDELISIAYDNLVGSKYRIYMQEESVFIFSNGQKVSEEVKKRKKVWICSYIKNNCNNVKKIKVIFEVIAYVFPNERIDYIKELFKYSQSIEIFKQIPLFPLSASWSGSEVPLIDKKIDFLKRLLSELKGIEYIEHRVYVKERIESYEQYKKDVLIKEYLENSDIA